MRRNSCADMIYLLGKIIVVCIGRMGCLGALPSHYPTAYTFHRAEVLHDINRPMQDIDWLMKFPGTEWLRAALFELLIESLKSLVKKLNQSRAAIGLLPCKGEK